MTTPTIPAAATKDALAAHPVYGAVRDLPALRTFMEHHAVCVLDFMSLLKGLQRSLTSMGPVWLPPARPEAARFINEIVLDEESDATFPLGRPGSHFEWYLAAMDEVGADAGPIRRLCEDLAAGTPPGVALERSALPAAARRFAAHTFSLLDAPLHVRAAVFFHGREDVIPRMFLPFVAGLRDAGVPCALLLGYLERHIEADGDHHGPVAERMLEGIYGGSDVLWAEGERAAAAALGARAALWDATLAALQRPATPSLL